MVKQPGDSVRGSRSGRPIMVLFDVLGQRWTLRVLWELRGGPASFRELRERCDAVSPTVLNDRLQQLKTLGLIERSPSGYRLTAAGQALGKQLLQLSRWADAWAAELEEP